MIFDWNACCRLDGCVDERFDTALTLPGGGWWAGEVRDGRCALDGTAAGAGDLLLGPGPIRLTALEVCSVTAVCLAGSLPEGLAGEPFFAAAASCPAAAGMIEQLAEGTLDDRQQSVLAYTLLCECAAADAAQPALPPLVAAAVAAIRENYAGLYGVEELSAQLGVSKEHLVREFRRHLGEPPGRYLTRVRLDAAKLLLLHREYRLEVVSSLCGFSGANYFCRVFKKYTGLTPQQWRARMAGSAPRPAEPLPQELEWYV